MSAPQCSCESVWLMHSAGLCALRQVQQAHHCITLKPAQDAPGRLAALAERVTAPTREMHLK